MASTTDDDEDDNSSISSGTDEFAYKTATAAYYQFNALMGRQQDSSEELTDDFILADTEDDTDGSVDLELGQADYWKCVKCNNKQNNPLYRYCEKCYQVRNSFFKSILLFLKSTTKHVQTCSVSSYIFFSLRYTRVTSHHIAFYSFSLVFHVLCVIFKFV